jgi:equilibrative nucleoside transporter 1/2/3
LLALLFSVRYGPRFSFTTRTVTGLLTSLFALGAVPLITNYTPDFVSLPTVMTVVFLSGVAISIMLGGVLGLAAIFPPRYITAVMIGQGVAGIVVIALSIIARVVFPNDKAGKSDAAYLYFSLAAFVILICLVLFFVLLRLPITHHYHSRHLASQRRTDTYVVNPTDDKAVAEVPAVVSARSSNVSIWGVFKRIFRHAFSVWAVFFVTLALFPGIITTIKPNPGGNAKWQSWFVTANLAMFMVGDWLGRTTPSLWVPKSTRYLWVFCVARFVFFPLFSFCISPHFFTADWIPLVIGAFFAYSNGLLSTLVMMFGPSEVEVHERETAGLVMTFMLNFGIFCGAHAGLLVLYIVTGDIGLHA